MTYKAFPTHVTRLADGARIPLDGGNADYAKYLAWLAASNTPDNTLAEDRGSGWSAIKAERDRREVGGVLVGTHWFHSDPASQIKQMGLVLMGAAVPPVPWKTMSGAFVTMTQTLAGQIFSASAASAMALFAHGEALKAALDASATPQTFDPLAGWPDTYEDTL